MSPERLRQIADHFVESSCCDRKAGSVTDEDLKDLGAFPIPPMHQASFGMIAPMMGWNAKCVFIYEKLFTFFERPDRRKPGPHLSPCETLVKALRTRADELDGLADSFRT